MFQGMYSEGQGKCQKVEVSVIRSRSRLVKVETNVEVKVRV